MTEIAVPAAPKRVKRAPKVVTDCDVVREIETLIGHPQDGTGYVDVTGAPCGPGTCGECGGGIEVAHLAVRPDGGSPAILDARRSERFGSWYLFRRPDTPPGVVLAEYLGRKDPRARFFNHRLVCPAAWVALEANPQGGATDADRDTQPPGPDVPRPDA